MILVKLYKYEKIRYIFCIITLERWQHWEILAVMVLQKSILSISNYQIREVMLMIILQTQTFPTFIHKYTIVFYKKYYKYVSLFIYYFLSTSELLTISII